MSSGKYGPRTLEHKRPDRPDFERPEQFEYTRPDRPGRPDLERPDIQRPDRPSHTRPDVPSTPERQAPQYERPNRPDFERPEIPEQNRPDRPEYTRPEHNPTRPEIPDRPEYTSPEHTAERPEIPDRPEIERPDIKRPDAPERGGYEDAPEKGGFDPDLIKQDAFIVQPHDDPTGWDLYEQLSTENFDEVVKQDSENLWVVAIISPDCESCKELLNDYTTITSAENLAGRKLKFGVVDASTDDGKAWLKENASDLDIKYTPTLVMYGKDKESPSVYDGLYNHDPINEYICNQCEVDGYAPEVPDKDTEVTSKDVKADVDDALGKDEDSGSIEDVVADALKGDATDVQGDIAAAVGKKAEDMNDEDEQKAEVHELSEEEALALI